MERLATVKIPTFSNEMDNGKEATFYKIEINFNDAKWELKKRYNAFAQLNDVLKKTHGNLPQLPEKTIMAVKKPEEINKRREGLEKYLQALVSKTDVYGNALFVKFLELDSHKPELAINAIDCLGKITHRVHGFRDLVFTHDLSRYFSVTSDTKVSSRIDSYITNLNMPWDKQEKDKGPLLPLGNLEGFSKDPKSSDRFAYERNWIKIYKSQAICCDYSEKLNIVAAGCDDGTVNVYQLNKDNIEDVVDVSTNKSHSDRVMRIIIDEAGERIYSIGEDKNFVVFDIKAKNVVSQFSCSKNKLTDMVIDTENKIAYVGDRGGLVIVIKIANPPTAKQSVRISAKGAAIRGMAADFASNLLFFVTHEDNSVHSYKIHTPSDPEGKLERQHSIVGPAKPRVAKYYGERNELYVGHQDGLLSVYNFDTNNTSPIYSGKVHETNINALQIMPHKGMVITGSGDKHIRVVTI